MTGDKLWLYVTDLYIFKSVEGKKNTILMLVSFAFLSHSSVVKKSSVTIAVNLLNEYYKY
jgi:hypothetical protein